MSGQSIKNNKWKQSTIKKKQARFVLGSTSFQLTILVSTSPSTIRLQFGLLGQIETSNWGNNCLEQTSCNRNLICRQSCAGTNNEITARIVTFLPVICLCARARVCGCSVWSSRAHRDPHRVRHNLGLWLMTDHGFHRLNFTSQWLAVDLRHLLINDDKSTAHSVKLINHFIFSTLYPVISQTCHSYQQFSQNMVTEKDLLCRVLASTPISCFLYD